MSGHSKWAHIKHKKAKMDLRRGKTFSKIIREITVAAKIGGGKIDANPRLRSAIEAAKAVNMPQENIERAIKKGTGELPGTTYEEMEYEGYGPGGVALIVKVLTDNKNRTLSEIKHIFSKYGGSLGSAGSVTWQFKSKGVIFVPKENYTEDTILAAALEAGAEDVISDKTAYQITTSPQDFEKVKEGLKASGVEFDHAELTRLPQSNVPLNEHQAERVLKLYETLEDQEDVQTVYANFDITEEVMERVSRSVA